MLVFKFGGASVKDAEGVKNVLKIIDLYKTERLLVVVSAMGKTTNALEEVCNQFYHREGDALQTLEKIKMTHLQLVHELFGEQAGKVADDIRNTFVEVEWILEDEPHEDYNFVYDQIVSIGEILSTRIIAAYLQHMKLPVKWIDARSYIQTDNTYREGSIDWETTEALIQTTLPRELEKNILVTQGFIGGTSENFTTTLGREGSDYSAAIFASCLQAESVTIWKDVAGVLNADPKLFPDTIKYEQLPYAEALEMTYYGASVIHSKTIKPLQNKHIPLLVKPFLKPEESGTVIGQLDAVQLSTPAIIVKKDQLLLSISTKDFSFIAEKNLSHIIGLFAEHQVKINTMQNSAMTFSCCIDNDLLKTRKLIEHLSEEYKVLYNTGLELYTVKHYTDETIKRLTGNRDLILEQRSRRTIQLLLRVL